MADFLLDLLSVTLGGGAVILLLLLLERIGGIKYAARWRCLAWLLLCLRLAIPVPILPDGPAPAPIRVEVPVDRVIYQYTFPAPTEEPEETTPPVDTAPVLPEERTFALSLSHVLFFLWLAGVIAVLGVNSIRHGRFLAYLWRWGWPEEEEDRLTIFRQMASRLGVNSLPALWSCVDLRSPMLVGVVRPRLVLPAEEMEGERLAYAVLHELTHYRCRHIWLKALVLWVWALHWFNPLVWLMAWAVERATELDCDERVLKDLPKEHRSAYSRAIVEAAAGWKGGAQ